MRVESIRLKNFRALRDVHLRDVPGFCVIVGANGTGKSSLFKVFEFLRDAMSGNATTALAKLGGNRGLHEVRSRGATGPLEIELKIRAPVGRGEPKLITYELWIDDVDGRVVITRELVKYRRGRYGKPWHFLDFAGGAGEAVTNELDSIDDEKDLIREHQTLKSPDILAIKALAQFERFRAAVAIGTLIENWHLSDFHISRARPDADAGYAEHLSREGENLSLVVGYLQRAYPELFDRILVKLAQRVPGLNRVESKLTEEGKVLLKFQDGAFQEPFLARFVSDGTIKVLAYLVLLHDPKPHPLLCIEEPENQLYPSLLVELAEEFREYAARGGQVFVSTHSPDFLNAVELDEAFWLVKRQGATEIRRAADYARIRVYAAEGDKLGDLWKQGLFDGADPA